MKSENNIQKILVPKNDVVFRALFRESNNRLTEALLTDILGEKVKIISNLDKHLDIKQTTQKLGVMDLRVELEDHTNCHIEIQLKKYKDASERFLYYLADTYSRQLEVGEEYKKINRCISIIIVDYEIDELKDMDKLATRWHMRDDETGRKILTNKFELVIIELPKVKKKYLQNKDDKLCQWMMFFDAPDSEEVKSIMDKNKDIREAKEELESVRGDYEVRRLAELRQKGIQEQAAALEYAMEEGTRIGIERGMQQGIQQGIQQGMQQGLEKGIEQGKQAMLVTAKKLIKMGLSIEEIIEVTGLTKEEIEND